MRAADQERVQDSVVSLLRRIYQAQPAPAWLLEDVVKLAWTVGSLSQRALARRVHRSLPAMRRLVSSGVIADVRGKVPAWEAAIAEVALSNVPAGKRNLGTYVTALADWLNEQQDPGFRRGLQQYLQGRATPLLSGRSESELDELADEFLRAQKKTETSGNRSRQATAKAATKSTKSIRKSPRPSTRSGRNAGSAKSKKKELVPAGSASHH